MPNDLLQQVFSARLAQLLKEDAILGHEDNPTKVLADRMGISQSAVRKWINADAMPEPEKIVGLGSMFNVSTDWLLGRTEVRTYGNVLYDEREVLRIPYVVELNGHWHAATLAPVSAGCASVNAEEFSDPKSLIMIRAPSDAMWPTIRKFETLIIDCSVSYLEENDIFLIGHAGRIMVRRIQSEMDGFVIMCDNKNHYPETHVKVENVVFAGGLLGAKGGVATLSLNPLIHPDKSMLTVIGRVITLIRKFNRPPT